MKTIISNNVFEIADTLNFHIDNANIRSQKSIEKLSATKMKEEEMEYCGETSQLNYVYEITKRL